MDKAGHNPAPGAVAPPIPIEPDGGGNDTPAQPTLKLEPQLDHEPDSNNGADGSVDNAMTLFGFDEMLVGRTHVHTDYADDTDAFAARAEQRSQGLEQHPMPEPVEFEDPVQPPLPFPEHDVRQEIDDRLVSPTAIRPA
ncbi:MAG: hypothetical protein CMJ49_07395 [Planctomycetaceae bacterium]|nr:hypothetical protein [Planctomycetaceae bacterium]